MCIRDRYQVKYKELTKELYSCFVAWDEVVDFTQKAIEGITMYVIDKFLAEKKLVSDDLDSIDLRLLSISYLGEMTYEEFADSRPTTVITDQGEKKVINSDKAN